MSGRRSTAGKLGASGFYQMLRLRTKVEYGFHVWPHLARNAASTEVVLSGTPNQQLTSTIINRAGSRNDHVYVHRLRAEAQARHAAERRGSRGCQAAIFRRLGRVGRTESLHKGSFPAAKRVSGSFLKATGEAFVFRPAKVTPLSG